MGTLRFANRTKSIKTKAIENATLSPQEMAMLIQAQRE
jgi:hypothetical protein